MDYATISTVPFVIYFFRYQNFSYLFNLGALLFVLSVSIFFSSSLELTVLLTP